MNALARVALPLLVLMSGCISYGTRPDSVPARVPALGQTLFATVGTGTASIPVTGEVILATPETVLLLADGEVVSASLASLHDVRLRLVTTLKLRRSNRPLLERLQAASRFPFGAPPGAVREILASTGQAAPRPIPGS